jgi:hypothetical protein
MSHISTISTEGLEFELETIKRLCQRQRWEFLENQTSHAWYGRERAACDHAIRIPGCNYELGLKMSDSGKYIAVADFWEKGGLQAALGEQGEVFRQLYLQESDIMWAEEKNFAWEEIPAEEAGAKKLVVFVNDDFGGGDW